MDGQRGRETKMVEKHDSVVDLFTGKKFESSEDIIRKALDEGKFKDSDFALILWKDTDPHPNKGEREREYWTSGVSYGALLWELEMFKNAIMFN